MKGFIKTVVAVVCVSTSLMAFATHHTSTTGGKMWTCSTNASSAPSGSAGEAADKSMANKGRSAGSAWGYAYKNCRDCTKITCSVSTK